MGEQDNRAWKMTVGMMVELMAASKAESRVDLTAGMMVE